MTEHQWLGLSLLLGVLLFGGGLYLVLSRRNPLLAMIGIELMLSAANLNLVTFNRYHNGADGQLMSLFIMLVAAAEAAVGLAILLGVWRMKQDTRMDKVGD